MKNGLISKAHFLVLMGLLLSSVSVSAMLKAQPKTLKERLEEADKVFLGKLTKRVVKGQWVMAELVVEKALKNVKKGDKVKVIWREKIGGKILFNAVDGAEGVAILSDKHEGRYWLRSDKFEDIKTLRKVENFVTPEAVKEEK